MLEGFADGWGGWRPNDVLGMSIVDLPETLVDDLITIRHLAGIIQRQKEKREEGII